MPNVGSEYTVSEVKYHLILLYQAGLLDCEPVRSTQSERIVYVLPFYLTWNGHEFLAKIKTEGVWQKLKATLTSKGGTLAFAVVNQLATKYALQAAGL